MCNLNAVFARVRSSATDAKSEDAAMRRSMQSLRRFGCALFRGYESGGFEALAGN